MVPPLHSSRSCEYLISSDLPSLGPLAHWLVRPRWHCLICLVVLRLIYPSSSQLGLSQNLVLKSLLLHLHLSWSLSPVFIHQHLQRAQRYGFTFPFFSLLRVSNLVWSTFVGPVGVALLGTSSLPLLNLPSGTSLNLNASLASSSIVVSFFCFHPSSSFKEVEDMVSPFLSSRSCEYLWNNELRDCYY